jgi:hypothetical protein
MAHHLLPVLLLICCFLQMAPLTFGLTLAWTGTMQSRNRLVPMFGHQRFGIRHSLRTQQLFSRSSSSFPKRAHDDGNDHADGQLQRIAIVGGGLAGLSTAFHLLEKTHSRCQVTIFDTAPVGTAGASSVAGGYVLIVTVTVLALLLHSFYSSGIIDIFATLD